MKKKAVVLALSMAMAASVVGCSSKKETEKATEAKTEAKAETEAKTEAAATEAEKAVDEAISEVVEEVQEAATEAAEEVGGVVEEAISEAAEAAGGAVEAISEAADVQDIVEEAVSEAAETADDTVEAISEAAADVLGTAEEAVSEAAAEVEEAVSEVAADATDVVEEAVSEAAEVEEAVSEAAADAADVVEEAVSEAAEVEEAVSEAAADAEDVVEEAASEAADVAAAVGAAAAVDAPVRNVVFLVNGNLGDKSFFDSAEAGLEALRDAGRITLNTVEMGGTDADQPKWLSTLYEVADSGEYDLIVCGTYQMPDYLKEVATAYPDQKFLIFDDDTYAGENDNVVNIVFKQNDLGYIVGTFAGMMTMDTEVERINEDKVIGFVGGYDSPVINDFMDGYIAGAQAVDPEIKVDVRYTSDYVDTAKAKEYGISMLNDSKCDIIWGVAGNAGNGAAEAILEEEQGWFIGVDSDQELTFSEDLAAITLTSGLKNVGNSLVWFFDQWDAGTGEDLFGTKVSLGIVEGGVGIVTDKNFDKYANDDIKAAVDEAIEAVSNGEITVPSAFDEGGNEAAQELRDSVRP